MYNGLTILLVILSETYIINVLNKIVNLLVPQKYSTRNINPYLTRSTCRFRLIQMLQQVILILSNCNIAAFQKSIIRLYLLINYSS